MNWISMPLIFMNSFSAVLASASLANLPAAVLSGAQAAGKLGWGVGGRNGRGWVAKGCGRCVGGSWDGRGEVQMARGRCAGGTGEREGRRKWVLRVRMRKQSLCHDSPVVCL